MEKTGKTALIDREKCIGCGACIQACPVNAIQMEPGFRSVVLPERCIGCGTCVELCHQKAPSLRSPQTEAQVV